MKGHLDHSNTYKGKYFTDVGAYIFGGLVYDHHVREQGTIQADMVMEK